MNPLLLALLQAGLMTQADAERINRQLDDNAMRAWAEGELLRAMQAGLAGQRERLLDAVRAQNGRVPDEVWNRLWAQENDLLWQSIRPTIREVVAEHAVVAAIRLDSADAWQLINEQMLAWVDAYYISADAAAVGSVPNLNAFSRSEFGRRFTTWQYGDLEAFGMQDGLPQLIRAVTPVFGPERAERIAVTESTRLFVESERAIAAGNPFMEYMQYLASADELVCPICGPAANTVTPKGSATFPDGRGFPPRHPRCRCGVVAVTGPAVEALRAEGRVAEVSRAG